jgi:acetoacetyl-CoA synthetase
MGPVYSGELQCRGLGMKVEAYDENGSPIIGREGELVCTAPFPSMPLYFWSDPDNQKYLSAYFDVYPGVWRHGDFIEVNECRTATRCPIQMCSISMPICRKFTRSKRRS